MRVVHVEAQRIATLSCDEPLREKAGEVTFVIRVPVATPVAEVLYCFFISNLAAAFQALFPTLKAPPTLPVQAHFTPQQYEAVTMAMGPLKRLRKVKFPLLHKPRPSSDSPTLQELQALERAPDADIDLRPQLNDIRMWRAVIRGPGETPFEGGTFQLLIEVGPEYPIRPPLIRFITRVFHPNIHFETGEICLDILKKEWSPAWSLQAACRAVMALLAAPDADSPLNCDAGNMVRAGDMRAFHSMARMYTAEYASVA